MRSKKTRAEKVLHTRRGSGRAGDVRPLRVIKACVAAAAAVFMAAAGVTVWLFLQGPLQNSPQTAQSGALQPSGTALPVYEDSFNLLLVNKSNPLKEGFAPQLTEYKGVQVDRRILPALEKMLADAQQDGCDLDVTGGYVDRETQQARYEAEVERLLKGGGYTEIRAGEDAKFHVLPGNYSELQTGMAVQLVPKGSGQAALGASPQFRWLEKNAIRYGFIQRYPADKTAATGHAASYTQFRYVGTEHATGMRRLGMCLEEYIAYTDSRG